MKYYLVIDGKRKGPFLEEELEAQGLQRDSLVWHLGLPDWVRADEVPALGNIIGNLPPPVPLMVSYAAGYWQRHRYTPASFQKLWFWWLMLIAMMVLLPLLGGLSLAVAEMERYSNRYPPGHHYYYSYPATPLSDALEIIGAVLLAGTALPVIAGAAVWCVLLYRFWNLIQDGYARTAPDTAIGFMFIPFFNFYWIFVAIHGLVVDLNNYPRRHGGPLDIPPVSTSLALVCSILTMSVMIPYVNLITAIPALVVAVFLTSALKNAAITILKAQRLPIPSPAEMIVATGIGCDRGCDSSDGPEAR